MKIDIKDTYNKVYQKYQDFLKKLDIKKDRVTLQDLKNRLGDNMPKTLENLEQAISQYNDADKQFVANRKEIEKEMLRIFADNDLGMDISGKVLDSVYQNGFYNTFQSGTSGGYCGSGETVGEIEITHGRLIVAHKLFGLSKDLKNGQLPRDQYEKYGHLLDRDKKQSFLKNRTHYGTRLGRENQVQIRFKREKVLCTWTFDDSIGEDFQPSLITDPKVESFDKSLPFNNRPQSNDSRNLFQWQRDKNTNYIELQFHGKLTIDDVESIVFAQRPDFVISSDLITKIKNKGIQIFYFDGNDVIMY